MLSKRESQARFIGGGGWLENLKHDHCLLGAPEDYECTLLRKRSLNKLREMNPAWVRVREERKLRTAFETTVPLSDDYFTTR
jgi:hypothetical protein